MRYVCLGALYMFPVSILRYWERSYYIKILGGGHQKQQIAERPKEAARPAKEIK